MKLFLLNLLLALFWAAVSGSFDAGTLIAGFVMGYVILLVARPVFGPRPYYVQIWRAIAFVVYFVWELVRSSFRVAIDVLHPRALTAVPAVVGFPLALRTDAAITVLSSLISLTPGTLSLDVSEDKRTLYVHSMYDGEDPDLVRRQLKRLETRVRELLEPEWASAEE